MNKFFVLLLLLLPLVQLQQITTFYLPTVDSTLFYDNRLSIPESTLVATVTRAVDGDTIKVITDNMFVVESEYTVRMIGVDTPETKHPKKGVEFFGPAAQGFTAQVLYEGRTVWLSFDKAKTDVYGRLLAYIWIRIDDEYYCFNYMLVANGYGRAYLKYRFDKTYMSIFKEGGEFAESNMLGLWEKPID